MKAAVIIQARMGSKRFPGKTLAQLGKDTILGHVVKRCDLSIAPRVIVATSTNKEDHKIATWCNNHGIDCFRGHPDNVAKRILDAATQYGVEQIVRVCADCPLIQPYHISALIEQWEPGVDYLGFRVNTTPGILTKVGLPELITHACLLRSLKYAADICEHVTWGAHTGLPVNCRWIDVSGLDGQCNTVDYRRDLKRLEVLCTCDRL